MDSDYDYLLAKPFLQIDFVFQTYVHSVENYECYAPSLSALLRAGVQMENAHFDFEYFLLSYSHWAYEWICAQLYRHILDGTPIGMPPGFENITNPEQDLQVLAQWFVANGNFTALADTPDFQTFQQELIARGISRENAYLFVRGHNLLERIVLKLLRWAAQSYINQRFAEFDPSERPAYQKHLEQSSFGKLLHENQGYTDSIFYQKILSDARLALQ